MTGPESYREAQAWLAMSDERWGQPLSGSDATDIIVALGAIRDAIVAQTHATLALAAATALRDGDSLPERDWQAWNDAAGVRKATT